MFEEPDEFRLDRDDPRGTSASAAVRTCAPAPRSPRLEARIAVNVFLDRVAAVRTVDETRYENVPVFWAHGPREMLVELD